MALVGTGEPAPLWLLPLASVEPKYWFVLTLSFAGALCMEFYRREQSNAVSGIANVLTGTIIGLLVGLLTLLEPIFQFGNESTRIIFSFLWGCLGRWLFVVFNKFLDKLQTDPKGAIQDLLSYFPKEILGEILDLIRQRYFKGGTGQNNKDDVQ